MWLRGCPIVLFLFLFFAAGAARAAAPLSLSEAIQYALEHSPAFNTARRTEEIHRLEYKSALAKLFPTLEFSTTDGLQNNIPLASTNNGAVLTPNPVAPWYSNLNLSLTENLYDNGVSLTNLSVATTRRELAELETRKARDALTLEVASEFYRFSSAVAARGIHAEQEAAVQKQYRLVTSLYHQGFKAKSDYLRLETQVQREEIDRIAAENSVTLSVANLRKILGASLDPEAPPLEFAPLPVPRGTQLIARIPEEAPKLSETYDFRMKSLQEEANEGAVTLARREHLPRVSVGAGVQYANQNYLNSTSPFGAGQSLNWNALVTLEYTLWDWGTKKRDLEIAERNRDIQGDGITATLLDDQARITALMAELGRLKRSLKLASDLLTLEEESARHLEAQYREGKASYLDLITGLTNLYGAKSQYGSAYFDTLQALATHAYYRGRIGEAWAKD